MHAHELRKHFDASAKRHLELLKKSALFRQHNESGFAIKELLVPIPHEALSSNDVADSRSTTILSIPTTIVSGIGFQAHFQLSETRVLELVFWPVEDGRCKTIRFGIGARLKDKEWITSWKARRMFIETSCNNPWTLEISSDLNSLKRIFARQDGKCFLPMQIGIYVHSSLPASASEDVRENCQLPDICDGRVEKEDWSMCPF